MNPISQSVSVVIPAYNEAKRIGLTLDRIERFFSGQARPFEVIVVDDGSADETSAVVERFCARQPDRFRLLRQGRNAGKGACVRRGMLEATGQLRLFSDADLSTPIEELGKLMAALGEGCDIAIGSRGLPQSELVLRQPKYRELMGQGLNRLLRLMRLTRFHDTQCGFKLFSREAAQAIFARQTIDRYGFDVEILWLAERMGFRIAEVPVRWIHDADSRVQPVQDGLRTLSDVLRLSLRRDGAVLPPARRETRSPSDAAAHEAQVRR
ncbi:MAG: glycosyltransferase family 2 protein [Candidatus Omnitrophica bacterium]|nr:glycosyltransferase family 2 protein [Candidatus Omnitrophota bacterium]